MNATELTGYTNIVPHVSQMPPEVLFEKRRGFGCSLLVELIGSRLYATLYRKAGSKRQTLNRTDCTRDVCFIERKIRAAKVFGFDLRMLGSKFPISNAEAKKLNASYGLEIKDGRL